MNLLFIGDVVGQSGCDFLESRMYKLKREYDIDVTVVNGENSAQGNGITPQSYRQLPVSYTHLTLPTNSLV